MPQSDPVMVMVDTLWRVCAYEALRASVWAMVGVVSVALARKVKLF